MDYKFTYLAEEDLDDILSYLCNELCNKTAAANFYSKAMEAIDRMCEFPESYPLVENEFVDRKIRKAIIDNYVLYYYCDIDEKLITILRIVYGKRDLEMLLRNI